MDSNSIFGKAKNIGLAVFYAILAPVLFLTANYVGEARINAKMQGKSTTVPILKEIGFGFLALVTGGISAVWRLLRNPHVTAETAAVIVTYTVERPDGYIITALNALLENAGIKLPKRQADATKIRTAQSDKVEEKDKHEVRP